MGQIVPSEGNDFLRTISCDEETDQGRPKQPDHTADQEPVTKFHPNTAAEAGTNPLVFLGTPVLGDVGGNGGGNALAGDAGEIIRPGDGIECGNGTDAQRVDLPLDQNLADRLNGLLEGCGAAIAENLPENAGVRLPLLTAGAQLRRFSEGIQEGKQGTECFREDRCNSAANNSEAQQSQKDQIQQGIDDCRKGEKLQRGIRVTHTFQSGGQGIVAESKGRPQEGNAKIDPGYFCNFPGYLKQQKNLRCQEDSGKGKKAADSETGKQGVSQNLLQLREILGAKGFAHQDSGSDGQSGDGKDHQIHHRCGNAFRGQGLLTNEAPGNDGVYSVVAQLQPVSQEKGQGMPP